MMDVLPIGYDSKAPTALEHAGRALERQRAFHAQAATRWQLAAGQDAAEARHYHDMQCLHLARMRQTTAAKCAAYAAEHLAELIALG